MEMQGSADHAARDVIPMNNIDPLVPSAGRVPVNPLFTPVDSDPPSRVRPFILRGISPVPEGVIEARHRTNATQRKIRQNTNLDNKVVDDSYTVPDD